jgi:hypothetical protein
MGVPKRDLELVRAYRPELQVLRECPHSGQVTAVLVRIEGQRGGESGWWLWSPDARQTYDVVLDTSNIANAIPDAWILSPPDERIRHVNIITLLRSRPCPILGRKLPEICWGGFADQWVRARPEQRTLGPALEYLEQLLNHQNIRSAAR